MDKKIFLLFVLLLIPITIAVDTPNINVKLAYTDPYPVEPGQNLILGIEISNTGGAAADNVVVELQPQSPFILLESGRKEIKTLYSGSIRVVEYNLFVDSSAVSAVYNIPIRIQYSGGNEIIRMSNIRVQGVPNFELIDVTTLKIIPGDSREITVTVKNLGTGKAKRTVTTFQSSSEMIKPILSGGNVYVGDVNPNEEKEIKFNILASPDSEYGVYTSTVTLNYEDESGRNISESFNLGILVSGKPSLQIIKTEVNRKEKTLSVKIANQGSAEAKGIKSELIINNSTFDVDYVSNIKADRSTTLKYNLPNTKKGILKLTYTGPDNVEYTQTEIIVWNTVPTSLPTWLIVIVVVAIGYFVWKKELYKKVLRLTKIKSKK